MQDSGSIDNSSNCPRFCPFRRGDVDVLIVESENHRSSKPTLGTIMQRGGTGSTKRCRLTTACFHCLPLRRSRATSFARSSDAISACRSESFGADASPVGRHAAVELHGYLAYIVMCGTTGRQYTVHGYKGKQVRDQIHCRDVAALFLEFFRTPRTGEAYNLGGGRQNNLSDTGDRRDAQRNGLNAAIRDEVAEQNRGPHL